MYTGTVLRLSYNQGQRGNWQNMFAVTRFHQFRYIKVLFLLLRFLFHYSWGKGYRSLYRHLRSLVVRYIKVPRFAWVYRH